jgi:hypothetical protein
MAINIIHLFKTMEQEIIKGGGKEENTQPYKTYEGWLSEIEEYIQQIVTGKKIKHKNMNHFNRKDYEITQERNYPTNKGKSNSYLEKKTREERFANIISKQTSSNKSRRRGKGEWLV